MGQQQLILLVLATVIVGVAIVVGIRAFTENGAKANADAMMQDAVRMANDIQALRQKPEPFGGVTAFTAVTFGRLGYPATGTPAVYTNQNGRFTLTTSTAGVVITGNGGTETTDPGPPVVTTSEQSVVVAVCGLTDGDIAGEIMRIGDQPTGATAPACS
jgi:hypothetical protein